MPEEILQILKDPGLSLEEKAVFFTQLITWVEENIPEENRGSVSNALMSLLDAIERNEPDLLDQKISSFSSLLGISQRLFVLCGPKSSWFTMGVAKYLDAHQMPYCLYGKETGACGRRIYVNCSGAEFGPSFLGKETVDLAFFLKTCYFSFPEYQDIQRTACQKEKEAVKGIITGMSYFRDGIDADGFPVPAVNLSSSSQDLYFDYLELQKHISGNTEWVVMGLAPYSLRYDESLAKTKNYRVPVYAINHGKKGLHHAESYAPLLPARQQIDALFGPDFCDEIFWDAYVPVFGMTSYDMEGKFDAANVPLAEQVEIGQQYNKPYENTLQENKQILKDYLAFCCSHSLKVIIVLPPFTAWYKDHWKQDYRDEVIRELTSLKDQFAFTLCDLSSEDWQDELFRNGSHVNALGRKKMTERISAVISDLSFGH